MAIVAVKTSKVDGRDVVLFITGGNDGSCLCGLRGENEQRMAEI